MTKPLLGEPTPMPQTTFRQGLIVSEAGELVVTVGGVVLPARWADPLVVAAGDPVMVALTSWPTGQSEATVMFRTSARPRAGRGVVTSAPVGSDTISVDTDEGAVEAWFLGSYTPTIGDTVLLSWEASRATVLGEVGAIPASDAPPPGAPAPPPGAATSGFDVFPATDAGSFNASSGVWATGYAPNASSVVQGSYGGSPAFTGAWFYGTAPSGLAGTSISRLQIWIAPRVRMGDYNNAAPLHLYVHTSTARPAGDVSRVAGPADFLVPPGFGGGWVDLPAGWGPIIVAGGGIGIAGGPYVGITGRAGHPQSGAVRLDWSR